MSAKSVLDYQLMAYVKTVIDYNDYVLKHGIKPYLADRFAQIAQSFHDQVCH
jgi:hypothetical protein